MLQSAGSKAAGLPKLAAGIWGAAGGTDLKTKSMSRKLNNWGAVSPRRGNEWLQEQRRLSPRHAQLLILSAEPKPGFPSGHAP